MRRTRLRAGLLAVVAVALAGIGYQVSRTVSSRKSHTLRDLGSDFLPQVAQHIRNFHRVKVENGRTVWEITAKDAQFFEKQNQIVVRDPQMTLYLSGGTRRAHISGNEGRLTLQARELHGVALRGRVVLRLGDMRLKTGEATYDQAHDMITAPGPVAIRGRTLRVNGRGMEFDVGPQHLRLLDDVRTVLRRTSAATS